MTIRGTGGRPRIVADGRDAEGKGIMVVKGKRVRIENLEFRGARVRDRNGAGIRVENGPFTVLECAFIDNENGILTGNVGTTEIAIEHSTFDGNGNAEGSAHNLYVGTIARLEVTGCLFSRSKVGHLLKSRAISSSVRYSRLSGEDGTSSYEMDFPNGGEVVVIGNLIQQGPASENSTIVSFGAEGYRWPQNI
ncbi:MAG: right-handed parallel beta-helix repeat-containing protein, partial [Vicinamibacterales bacterium]